ncbi:MAG TPA: transglutaminase domain-containing protein [Vicinamibacterales bacterium]
MDRREFLASLAAAPLAIREQTLTGRRTFEITTRLEFPGARGRIVAWVPMPLATTRSGPYQTSANRTSNGVSGVGRPKYAWAGDAAVMMAEPTGDKPFFNVTYTVSTQNHRVDLVPSKPVRHPVNLNHYLRPTKLIPTDGIVRETALAITKPHGTQLTRARAIYDWIVEHTVRDPDVKGCGIGDIRWMLETRNLSGKCADLNALFVGLARAIGMPARDLYGLRVAPSEQFPSLGRVGGDVTTAQHCRAEVWITNIGWVPVDPADVRKVILEEKPGAPLDDPYIAKARNTLFGSWEMNWFAYNDAHDVVLPGSTGKPLPFLMYPQAEIGGERRDSLDPATFKYTITARQL